MTKTADDYLTLYKRTLDQFVEGPPAGKNRNFDNTFGILAESESERSILVNNVDFYKSVSTNK